MQILNIDPIIQFQKNGYLTVYNKYLDVSEISKHEYCTELEYCSYGFLILISYFNSKKIGSLTEYDKYLDVSEMFEHEYCTELEYCNCGFWILIPYSNFKKISYSTKYNKYLDVSEISVTLILYCNIKVARWEIAFIFYRNQYYIKSEICVGIFFKN